MIISISTSAYGSHVAATSYGGPLGNLFDGAIHYACNGKKYWITSPTAFAAYGFSWDRIYWVSHIVALAYAPGEYPLDGTTPPPS